MSSSISKMNSNNKDGLSLLHPDNIKESITHILNMPFDESIEFDNADYYISSTESLNVSAESLDINNESNNFNSTNFEENYILPPPPPVSPPPPPVSPKEPHTKIFLNSINLGDGKMDYIENKHDKLMITNAWQAITQTNTWNFMSEEIESFMWSSDPRIYKISEKMEELGYSGHSGCSFGFTMRNMQYLAQKGEDEFKKLFEKEINTDNTIVINKTNKFLEYTGGS